MKTNPRLVGLIVLLFLCSVILTACGSAVTGGNDGSSNNDENSNSGNKTTYGTDQIYDDPDKTTFLQDLSGEVLITVDFEDINTDRGAVTISGTEYSHKGIIFKKMATGQEYMKIEPPYSYYPDSNYLSIGARPYDGGDSLNDSLIIEINEGTTAIGWTFFDVGGGNNESITFYDKDNNVVYTQSYLPSPKSSLKGFFGIISSTPIFKVQIIDASYDSDDIGYDDFIFAGTAVEGDIAPSAPINVSAAAGDGKAIISWHMVQGAASYNIYWSATPGVTKQTGTKISDVTSPYTHINLTNDETYYYVVTSENSYGESSESHEVSATPLAFSVIIGEDTIFNTFNVIRTTGTADSDGEHASSYIQAGPYQDGISEAWAGVRFHVLQSPNGTTMSDATISITFSYELEVNFDVLSPGQGGGGSADARLYAWIANYKKELDNIVFIHYSDYDKKSGTMTFTHTLSDAPTWTHLYAGQYYEVTADLYTHAQVYIGDQALSYAQVTVQEIRIEFP